MSGKGPIDIRRGYQTGLFFTAAGILLPAESFLLQMIIVFGIFSNWMNTVKEAL